MTIDDCIRACLAHHPRTLAGIHEATGIDARLITKRLVALTDANAVDCTKSEGQVLWYRSEDRQSRTRTFAAIARKYHRRWKGEGARA